MNQAIAWVKDFWHGLPQPVQCAGVIFAAGAGASLGKTLFEPATFSFQWSFLQHQIGTAVGAGVVALRVFYMRPGPGRNGGPSYEGS